MIVGVNVDFQDTSEEAAFRAEVRDWLKANAKPRTEGESEGLFSERSDDAEYLAHSREWQAKKFDAGWAGITWPKEYGGRGGTPIQQIIWGQEAAQYDAPDSVFGIGIGMGGPTVMTHGSDELKARLLPRLLRGDDIWCQLFSEPGPDRMSRRLARVPSATATSGSSMGRRCGPVGRTIRSGACSWRARISTCPSTTA